MKTPRLYVFAISHYCEKARWALEHLAIEHTLDFQPPGVHMQTAAALGVPDSSLPILETASEVVQGSAAIIDWADSNTPSDRRLTPDSDRARCSEIERRLDDVAGVHVRRLFYSEALVEHSETVKPIFLKDLEPTAREALDAAWPLVREAMIQRMDLGEKQGEDSRAIVAGELAWLDELLADGRRHLVADRFTRADLTAAALLARVADAEEHPQHRFMQQPPRLAALQERWHDRPCLAWIREIYRLHRRGSSPSRRAG